MNYTIYILSEFHLFLKYDSSFLFYINKKYRRLHIKKTGKRSFLLVSVILLISNTDISISCNMSFKLSYVLLHLIVILLIHDALAAKNLLWYLDPSFLNFPNQCISLFFYFFFFQIKLIIIFETFLKYSGYGFWRINALYTNFEIANVFIIVYVPKIVNFVFSTRLRFQIIFLVYSSSFCFNILPYHDQDRFQRIWYSYNLFWRLQ